MITIGSVTGFNTVTKTTASSPATAVGDMVLANAVGGVVTVTLPTAPPTNSQVVVKKIDTSANAVNVGAAANIDNVATVALTAPYAAATFTYDGAMWRVSGSSPTLTATATSLAAGSSPTAVVGGTALNPTLAIGVPAGGSTKVTASGVALGTQGASQSAFTWYTIPSICARGLASLLTITADSAGTFDVEVRGAGAPTGNLWMQAIGITTAAYSNPMPWYVENDAGAQSFYVGVRNTSTASHTFTLTSLRVEKFA